MFAKNTKAPVHYGMEGEYVCSKPARTWRFQPMSTDAGQRHVVIIGPSSKGGISRLFAQMREGADAGSFKMSFASSHDGKALSLLRFPWQVAGFIRLAGVEKPAVCHINLASRGSTVRKTIYAAICRTIGLPYVVHLHGGQYREFYRGLPAAGKSIIDWLFAGASRVIVLGEYWRDFVINEIGVQPDRAVVLANAVKAPERLAPRGENDPPVILFLGRLGARKGIPELVEALCSPEMKNRVWRAVLAGDGDAATFASDIEAAGMTPRISLPGWVETAEVAGYLSTSDILVLPSHAENLPLSMLEGMGYGLCPVATPVGAVPEVIRDGDNGLLVPVGDPQALSAALVRLIDDPALRARLGTRARADFEAHYDMRTYREKLEAIYLDVLKEAGSTRRRAHRRR